MYFTLLFTLVLTSAFVNSQVLNRVRLVDNVNYIINVINEVVSELEERGWSSMKLSDFSQRIDDQVIDWKFNGTVNFTNGFLDSIQHLDINNNTLNQIWRESADEEYVTVEITGLMRMLDLALGYDVRVRLDDEDEDRYYTGIIVQPMVTFMFSVLRNVHTRETTVSVNGAQISTQNPMDVQPKDRISDVVSVYFTPASTAEGVMNWASEVFLPIATDVVMNKTPYPELCYDCAVELFLSSN